MTKTKTLKLGTIGRTTHKESYHECALDLLRLDSNERCLPLIDFADDMALISELHPTMFVITG